MKFKKGDLVEGKVLWLKKELNNKPTRILQIYHGHRYPYELSRGKYVVAAREIKLAKSK